MSRNIIVVGQQKTGTTGVYSLIKSALAPIEREYFFSFEPTRGEPLAGVLAQEPSRNILTKIMYKNIDNFSLDVFDRRVLTVRDPRDTIVSTLLFKPMLRNIVGTVPMDQHQRFIDGLQRKEAAPRSVSIVELMELADSVGYRKHKPRRLAQELLQMGEFSKQADFHVVRYEDFVDGKVSDLATYLGLPLDPEAAKTPSWLTHISRSRGHGAWRSWFTEQDVEHYRPILARSMRRLGYPDDWTLDDHPEIPPETSSAYVADRIAKRRRELAVARREPEQSGQSGQAGASIATLHSMASDGNARSALELARRLNRGKDFAGRWPASARYWARQAEIQGLAPAGELRRRLDEELGTTPP